MDHDNGADFRATDGDHGFLRLHIDGNAHLGLDHSE